MQLPWLLESLVLAASGSSREIGPEYPPIFTSGDDLKRYVLMTCTLHSNNAAEAAATDIVCKF